MILNKPIPHRHIIHMPDTSGHTQRPDKHTDSTHTHVYIYIYTSNLYTTKMNIHL